MQHKDEHFRKAFEQGYKGEEFLLKAHADLKRAPDGERRWDLIKTTRPFARVEVKTDSYPLQASPNFFMERKTYVYKGGYTLQGGPWRAEKDGVDILVYLFSNGGTADEPGEPVAFWFDFGVIPQVVTRIEELIESKQAKYRRVRSGGCSAQGYLVPRVLLQDLYEERRYFKEEGTETT